MTGNERLPTGSGPDIEAELRELRVRLAVPEPAAETLSAVMARIDQQALPTRRTHRLHNRWRTVTVIVVGVRLAVLAVSPAGAAIREWLGFGALVVEQEQPVENGSTPAPSVPSGAAGTSADPQGPQMSLDRVRAAVSFPWWFPLRSASRNG